METTEKILKLAAENRQQAFRVIEQSNVIGCWQSVGARINLIGSLKTGLLMKHRDIDFHVYTSRLNVDESFRAMTRLAENPRINSPAFNKNVLPLKKDIFVLPKKTPPILSKYKTLLICYFLQYHLIVD